MDVNSNSSNKDAVIANEYYNDNYCSFTDKEEEYVIYESKFKWLSVAFADTLSDPVLIYVRKYGVFFKSFLFIYC